MLIMWITGAYLLLMALFDIRSKSIPAFLSTTAIFLLAIRLAWLNPLLLSFGIVLGVFGLLLYELNYFSGMADIKALIIIGLTLGSFHQVIMTMMLTVILGLAYQVAMLKIMKYKEGEEIPFIPVFFIVYVVLNILQYIG